jgi:signal transduction histidine kinase/ligand-binding sensor domain-containing protein/DNA-binding response OmpR family regulator
MKKTFGTVFLLLSALFSATTLQGVNLRFKHYMVEDGLSSNTVRCVLQDKNGFIWIGTEGGLNRFDGVNFRNFLNIAGDTTSLGNNYVYTMLEDSRANLWIGTDHGVSIFNPKTEKFHAFRAKTANGVYLNGNVQQITVDADSNLWFGTQGQGVYRFNPSKNHLEQFAPNGENLKNNSFTYYVYADKNGRIWVSSNQRGVPVRYFDGVTRRFVVPPFFEYLRSQRDMSIHRLIEDSAQRFWLGTWEDGICSMANSTGSYRSILSSRNGGGILHVHSMLEYAPGQLMVGTDDGLACIDTQTGNYDLYRGKENDEKGLSDKFVYPVYKDREGGIWIGTYYGGLNYVLPNSNFFEHYQHSDYANSVGGNVIGKFCPDPQGNLWIATDDGGLSYMDTETGRFTNYRPEKGRNSLSYHNVHALCLDGNKLWVGTYSGGLNQMDLRTKTFKKYSLEAGNTESLSSSSIYSVFKDRSGVLWVGTTMGIDVYVPSKDNFHRVRPINASTIDIRQDARGIVWFATWGDGLYRFDPKKRSWKHYTNNVDDAGSLTDNQVNCLSIDEHNQMWVGTGNGLCRYDAAKDAFVQVPLKLKSRLICDILSDRGFLWITTTNGLIRLNPSDNTFKTFTKSDGLQSDQFNLKSAVKLRNGKIFVGTANGFNSFYPDNLKENTSVPQVVITNIQILNENVPIGEGSLLKESVTSTKKIKLSWRQNIISIEFAALSFAAPLKNQYAYKLEGFDNDWVYVGNDRKATYTNLPAGSYVFRVKASNNDGLWNEDGTSLKIIVRPPFWFSTLFILIYILLAAWGLYKLYLWFQHRNERRHEEELQHIYAQKEKEIYDAKINFFTFVAHEIRTPVSLIVGPLERILHSKEGLSPNFAEHLNIVDRNAKRLVFLVNQLLDFRKVEQKAMSMHFNHLNLSDLLTGVLDGFSPILGEKELHFSREGIEPDVFATVDSDAFVKIATNLLSNATKYAFDRVEVSLTVSPEDKDYIQLTVRDDGPGIPAEEQEHIFKPFYQVSGNSQPGTGIGLSLLKLLVDAHHGYVRLSSTPGSGTVFTVILPKEQDADAFAKAEGFMDMTDPSQEEWISSEMSEASNSAPVMLVVEDNADMRKFICQSFSDKFRMLEAENGRAALLLMDSHEVDFIITDLMMPEMDGLEFCRELHKNILRSHIPIVLLTAKTDMSTKIEAIKLGADVYMEKPFSIELLMAQVDNLLESRQLLRKRYTEMPFVPLTTIAGNSADEAFLSKINQIVEANFSNVDFSIQELAEQLFVSRSGLFVKIKSLVGITPNEFIQLVRLKKAAQLIRENKYRINEVCYMVGFNNPSYFSKCFQKQFGKLPKDFRNPGKEQPTDAE